MSVLLKWRRRNVVPFTDVPVCVLYMYLLVYSAFVILLKGMAELAHVDTTTATTTASTFTTTSTIWPQGSDLNDLSSFLYDCWGDKKRWSKMWKWKFWTFCGILTKNVVQDRLYNGVLCNEMFKSRHFLHKTQAPSWKKNIFASAQCAVPQEQCVSVIAVWICKEISHGCTLDFLFHLVPLRGGLALRSPFHKLLLVIFDFWNAKGEFKAYTVKQSIWTALQKLLDFVQMLFPHCSHTVKDHLHQFKWLEFKTD